MTQHFEVSAEWMAANGKGEAARTFPVIGAISFLGIPGKSLVTVSCDDIGWVVSEEHGRFVEPSTESDQTSE